ncbi:MAG: perosamine synthetase [Burkholderiales bacterium]
MTSYSCLLAGHLGSDPARIHLYWKGRVALFAALKAAGVGAGDEVIIPALTCVVVPNAILYCNATPVYSDVRADTLTLDPDSVTRLVNRRTRAIIIQNTFGLSADVDVLVNLARERGLLVLEDCTHGFGGSFRGQPNGALADASFFSTQWNKPYSTGLGGILLVNRPEQFPGLDTINRTAIAPGKGELASLWLSMQARRFLLTDGSYWAMLRLYRRLSKSGFVTGSSSAQEIESTDMPPGFFKQHSPMQAVNGVSALRNLHDVIRTRRKSALAYRKVLAMKNKWHVPAEHDANNAFLKFPILARNRKQFFDAAEEAKVRLSDWFLSPIHPVERDFSAWNLSLDAVPTAAAISRKLLTINTEARDAARVCEFISRSAELIE